MKHKLFNSIAALSMAMFFTLGLLWATDRVGHSTLHITYDSHPNQTQNNYDLTLSRSGILGYSTNHFPHWNYARLSISYWAAMSLCLVLPAVWLRRKTRATSQEAGVARSADTICGPRRTVARNAAPRLSADSNGVCNRISRHYTVDSKHKSYSTPAGFWLLIGLLALFAAAKPILFDTLDPDCFWHLRVADQLHHDGIGPIVDRLSFASSRQPWTPYSWLAELGMKAVWDAGGYRAAVAVTAAMQGLLAVLLALCCREALEETGSRILDRAANPSNEVSDDDPLSSIFYPRFMPAVVATAIGLFLTLPYLSFRPVTLGLVLLFTIAWLILRDQRLAERSRAVWLIIPLTVLLTNIHLYSVFVPMSVFAMGIGSMIEERSVIGRSSNRYGYLSCGVTLACLCTPMLPGAIRTAAFYGTRDQMVTGPVIAEMQSFARGPLGFVSAGLVLAILACIAVNHRRLRVGHVICVIGGTLLMFKLGRFAPLFALAACPALAVTMPPLKDRVLARPAVVSLLAMVLLIGAWRVGSAFPAGSTTLARWVNRHGPETPGYPCAAADFVDRSAARSSGHLINEFSWGGYLSWRLADQYQVLLDGRTQVYPQSLWQATYLGSDHDRRVFLASIQADAALLPANKSTFRSTLIGLGWTSAYRDDRAEVLLPPVESASIR